MTNKRARLLPVLLMCVLLVSCKGKTLVREEAGATAGEGAKETVVVPEDRTAAEQITSEDITSRTASVREDEASSAKASVSVQTGVEGGLGAVHFDFDRYTIRDEDRAILKKNAEWLRANPSVKVTIEGHADERGETEYNLALGEKRADTVKRYIETLGAGTARLSTISYGEERPADTGHTEEAWAKNRRAEFKASR